MCKKVFFQNIFSLFFLPFCNFYQVFLNLIGSIYWTQNYNFRKNHYTFCGRTNQIWLQKMTSGIQSACFPTLHLNLSTKSIMFKDTMFLFEDVSLLIQLADPGEARGCSTNHPVIQRTLPNGYL